MRTCRGASIFTRGCRLGLLLLGLTWIRFEAAQAAADEFAAPVDQEFTAEVDGSLEHYVELVPAQLDPATPRDVIIALHGHGSDRWQYVQESRGECRGVRDVALRHGMLLVSPDYRAKTSWMGPTAERDLVQLIGLLRERHRVRRVYLAGGSMGGTAALIFAALHPELIAGVLAENGTANMVEYDQFQEAIRASYGGTKQEVLDEYEKRSPELAAGQLRMPLALTVGAKDTLVPPDSVRRLAKRLLELGHQDLLLADDPQGGHETGYEPTVSAMEFVIRAAEARAEPRLSRWNPQVPFPFIRGGERTWPMLSHPLTLGASFQLVARDGATVLAEGERLEFEGLAITVTSQGELTVAAREEGRGAAFQLELTLNAPDREPERQTLELRPAPPDRPISYYADFGDDLINTFMHPTTGNFSAYDRSGFDQYFRRLQCHGVRRLIVWLSPFPYITDPANYAALDWDNYARQARAILDDSALSRVLDARSGFKTWSWVRYLLATRMDPQFGTLVGQSAADHGIALSLSYRPFEAALTKYYEVPAFDDEGNFLWGFLPLASPTINYHPDQVGWKHYRELLRDANQPDAAELASIELQGVNSPEQFAGDGKFAITASPYPPLADDSRVLVRGRQGEFQLRPFAEIRAVADSHLIRRTDVRAEATASGLRLLLADFPREARFLTVEWIGAGNGPDVPALVPVVLRSKAGNRLGRETTYWVSPDPNDPSRVAGITVDGEYRAEFQACEHAQRLAAAGPERVSFSGHSLVIDVGAASTVELIDFNQPLARQNAVNEIATILKLPGFDDIFLNTRSHVDLAPSMADGDEGMRPAGYYWHVRRGPRHHLGLDKAYYASSTAALNTLLPLARDSQGVERITTWQDEEWRGSCQTALSGGRFPWRWARNRATADGLRLLLEDLEQVFPGRRIRMVVPASEAAVLEVEAGLDALPQPDGAIYGRSYYDHLWTSNNHIPAAGEGAAMVDLTGLSVQPALLGSGGYLPDSEPFQLYLRSCVADLAANRGSSFRGPRSYFFEGQTTLRMADQVAARRGREEMICRMLGLHGEIGEVILYEAADWLYTLPLADSDLCSHGFLDRCNQAK